jgi:hypothetical protein
MILYLAHCGTRTNAEAASAAGESLGPQAHVISFDLQ